MTTAGCRKMADDLVAVDVERNVLRTDAVTLLDFTSSDDR
jgi:hypothetical protein